MANKTLKGLTVKIGGDTSDLLNQLDKVDKKSRSLSGELGQINKLLKLDPKNTDLLAQKQKVLADAITNTESKLDTLREAEKQVQAQFERGEVSEEQYRALQREIIETENKLGKYKNAAKETADAVEGLGKESREAAESLDKTEKEAKEADNALREMGSGAADTAKSGLAAATAAAVAVIGSLVAMTESSREYRTEMAKLDTAFVDAGHTSEVATQTYKKLQSVLGESDQAVEAANHLAKLCSTEEELAQWTDIAAGVYASFGASLPIEGLTEAANETARVGQITGPMADALNWAAKAGETFGVKIKEATEENEEWNKSVQEATSAEDYFNLALQECSNEQERQQLITKTLTKLYSSAAAKYKATNKEIIRANEATEKWNETMADLGGTVEPVITDIKEMGITLAEDAQEPLKDLADFIRTKVLPAVTKAGNWVQKNGPEITATVAGLTAAVVAHKAAVAVATLAEKGWTVATLAQAAAQKVLNAAMASNPYGLVLTLISGLVVATIAYVAATRDATEADSVLTEAERELADAADAAAEAFRDQKKATQETLGGIKSQMDHVSKLADELFGLADAQGEVAEKDQARAQFILNELNQALDTEYSMVDGIIQKYGELKTSIEQVIQSKLANSLLEAANDDYVAAIQNESAALENANLKYKEKQAQLQRVKDAEAELAAAKEAWNLASEAGDHYAIEAANMRISNAQYNLEEERGILGEKKAAYDQAALEYGHYSDTIAAYEEAEAAVASGNYQLVTDLLVKKGGAFTAYSDTVEKETANVLDTLYKEAVDAGLEAERTRRNFENGVEGYTEEMVTEAERNYNEAMDKFANAYADAEAVGEDLTGGMTAGAENGRNGLLAKARSLVLGFLNAARAAADSHSPSRKAIKIFEDIGAGAEIGVDNKTEDVKRSAERQVDAVMDAYREPEATGQQVFRNIADQQVARYSSEQAAVASNGPLLERILTAIEKGQVLLLDGEAVVGGTVNRMDNRLGALQVLADRGAT